jgi:nanoRNase/pAp phosphatase (c-di-AMP/oligoRNAs hydrolase)
MNVICISHAEDTDGLVCAAYLRRLKDATITLVTYDDFEEALRNVKPPADEVYLCDLNIREDLVEEISRINNFARMTIVDHHPTAEGLMKRLGESGVEVIHSLLDCASILLYDRFREDLGSEDARLAAYAAVSDYFEEGPNASKLLNRLDKHFVQHEALILTHALHRKSDAKFKLKVVSELSRLTPPHRIKGVPEAALAHLEHVSKLLETLTTKATKRGRLAYIEEMEGASIGSVAGLLIDSLGVDVGLCYKREERNSMSISIRAARGLDIHLGKITRRLAGRYGGFGGGHSRASGASIPQNSYMTFIKALDGELLREDPN